MFQKLIQTMYPSKDATSPGYLATTNALFTSCIGRVKAYLTTPRYFDPYFDPYSDVSLKETTVPGKWEFALFKTDFVHVAATICHYFFSNDHLVDDIQTIANMKWVLVKKGRRTTHVSDLICFKMDIQRRDAIKHVHSLKRPQRYPSIQYDSSFLDEKWHLVDKLDQKDDSDWDVVGTYQVKPVPLLEIFAKSDMHHNDGILSRLIGGRYS